jgi:hypothetical protein
MKTATGAESEKSSAFDGLTSEFLCNDHFSRAVIIVCGYLQPCVKHCRSERGLISFLKLIFRGDGMVIVVELVNH